MKVASPCRAREQRARMSDQLIKLSCERVQAAACLFQALLKRAVNHALVLMQQRRDVLHVQDRRALHQQRRQLRSCISDASASAGAAPLARVAPASAAPAAR